MKGFLWWVPPRWTAKGTWGNLAGMIVTGAGLVGTIAGVEGRIFFYAFRSYIMLRPPWSYICLFFSHLVVVVIVQYLTGAVTQSSGVR